VGRVTSVGPAAPHKRPEWLRKYALVSGRISSAPLDLAQRFDAVTAQLDAEGWRVSVKSIGTDFGLVPSPRDQFFELYLWRPDDFSPDQAQEAVNQALESTGLGYSATESWAGEVVEEVIRPTIEDVKETITRPPATEWLLIGALLVGAVIVLRS
jgi:hypothetical protein